MQKLILTTWVTVWLSLIVTSLTWLRVSAQSPNCHQAILKSMLKVQDCTNMTPKQINKLDGIISAVDESQGTLKHEDPAAMACLTALMWDIVHYKAELWKGAFNPNTACTWPEMMEYFTSIPRIAAIYGTPVPAAYKLVDSPKQ